ncbi:MAG TPA: putative quinol monooxygenase [Gemmatimonadales bacterium]|jgi:quinol monooxygenase YgiN|nr:putative quinol monooxygenase [Gemmatimonadales bacterium]
MSKDDVTVVIRYEAKPGMADTAARELTTLINTVVKEEPACRGIWLHQDTGTPEKLLLVEHWTSQEAYTGPHMQTPHITAFVGRALEFLAGPPEITFWRGIASAIPA